MRCVQSPARWAIVPSRAVHPRAVRLQGSRGNHDRPANETNEQGRVDRGHRRQLGGIHHLHRQPRPRAMDRAHRSRRVDREGPRCPCHGLGCVRRGAVPAPHPPAAHPGRVRRRLDRRRLRCHERGDPPAVDRRFRRARSGPARSDLDRGARGHRRLLRGRPCEACQRHRHDRPRYTLLDFFLDEFAGHYDEHRRYIQVIVTGGDA